MKRANSQTLQIARGFVFNLEQHIALQYPMQSLRLRVFPRLTQSASLFSNGATLNPLILDKATARAASSLPEAKSFYHLMMASTPAATTEGPRQPQGSKGFQGKRPHPNGHGQSHGHNYGRKPAKTRKKEKPPQEGSHEEVLLADIRALLATQTLSDDAPSETQPLPERFSEIEVDVVEISSTGDGLAKQKGSDHIYVVPFTVPGDTARVKVYRPVPDQGYTAADFLSIVKPSPLRDDSRIQCKYFAKCSGCQFQMLEYPEQLRLKKNIVVKAYRNFSQLPPELVPEILDTIGSPLQYHYRTKLTPHFDGDPKGKRTMTEVPPIGFTPKTSRKVLDIEDCPIATDAVRKGLKDERARMATEFASYKRGATILLRESTQRVPKTTVTTTAEEDAPLPLPEGVPADAIKVEAATHTDYKTCIADSNATSTEYVDNFIFTNPAGSFFQNNNSILPPFTEYIRQHILPPSTSPSQKPIRNLIDAYSGSGLFTITQSSLFPGGSIGIDIAGKSIEYARRNALLNGLAESQCRFIAADAPELFKSVRSGAYDADETVVVLDPPRKGCDASFLKQLLQFAPRRVVYVSCNVHTQARDVGVLVRGDVSSMVREASTKTNTSTSAPASTSTSTAPTTLTGEVEGQAKAQEQEQEEPEEEEKKERAVRYEIESIRGFDFFPQTGHVEGVAVLNRVDV